MTRYEIDKLFYYITEQTENTRIEYLKKSIKEHGYTYESVAPEILKLIDHIIGTISNRKLDGVFHIDGNGKRVFGYNYFTLRFTEQVEGINNTFFPTTRTKVFQNENDKNKLLLLREAIEKEIHQDTTIPSKLIKSLLETQQSFLYTKLTEKSLFLAVGTDYSSFCFVFGNSIEPDNFKPLEWQQNKQLLRELLTALKCSDIDISKNKYTLPPYFKDKKKKSIDYLPNNKPKLSALSDKINDIVIKLRQTK